MAPRKKRKRPSASFACPGCGERMGVIASDRVGRGRLRAIRRRRECPSCGERATYYELPESAPARAVALYLPSVAGSLRRAREFIAAVKSFTREEAT